MDQLDRQILRILHELCTVALDSLPVASKDMVFLGGSQARKTYLVLAGTFTYHHDDGEEKVDAESCSWVAEMCLWPLRRTHLKGCKDVNGGLASQKAVLGPNSRAFRRIDSPRKLFSGRLGSTWATWCHMTSLASWPWMQLCLAKS